LLRPESSEKGQLGAIEGNLGQLEAKIPLIPPLQKGDTGGLIRGIREKKLKKATRMG